LKVLSAHHVAFKQRIGRKSCEIAKNLCQPRFDLVEYTQLPVWRLAKGAFPLAPISTLEKLSMKKTLIAMAAVAVTGAASAQVSLYGIMDMGYGSVTVESDAGVQSAKTTGMTSGVQSGSRWGMKGSEDLGGGLTASFQLESAITADTAASTGFTRTSKLALSGGFGTVSFGRQYTPTFSLIGATDVTGTDATATVALNTGVRADSMFMYTSPSFGGVTVTAGTSGDATETTAGTTAKTQINDMTVTYAAGPLMVGVGSYSTQATTAGVAAAKTTQTTIGGTYDMGVAKVFLNNMNSKVSGVSSKETNVGVSMPMGAVSLLAGYGRNTETGATSSTDYTIGADYTMSKRTNAYARVFKQQLVDAGNVTKGFYVGLRHKF
jgi:predicted porin